VGVEGSLELGFGYKNHNHILALIFLSYSKKGYSQVRGIGRILSNHVKSCEFSLYLSVLFFFPLNTIVRGGVC
jgi:hypothetical protein